MKSVQAPLMMGVSVYSAWADPRPEFGKVPSAQCPYERLWSYLPDDRVPALGQYNEADPAITSKRLQWMQQGGIDYACYQVEWAHDRHELLMAHCADNHSPESPVRFCISFWDALAAYRGWISYWQGWDFQTVEDSWRAFARTVATRYMTRDNYLRIDGRPVLFYGRAHAIEFYPVSFGPTPESIIFFIREEVRRATGGKTPYIVATSCDPAYIGHLDNCGFDAFTEYLIYSDSWEHALDLYRTRWAQAIELCKKVGIDYLVPATAGYNAAGRRSVVHSHWRLDPVQDVFMPTPSEFTEHLKEARAFSSANAKYTHGQVITFAWNEFGEGGIIEPMKAGMIHSGDEMLLAHRAATL